MPSFSSRLAPRRRRQGALAGTRRERRSRGVAMIIAIVSIAILTVVATDFAYNSRVDLQLATNQRDEVRAYYMARSGMSLARLLLRFQKQVDQTPIPNPMNLLSQLGLGGQQPPGQQTPQPTSLNLQLYKMARVDCHMLRGLVNSEEGGEGGETAPLKAAEDDENFKMDAEEDPAAREMAAQMTRRSFGGFEGCFLATITDEEEKLNVHRLIAGAGDALPTALRMMDMMNDKRFEFLWERDDANKVRSNPMEVLQSIKDWADDDETGTGQLNPADPVNPLPSGFSDEGANYSRYEPSYEPKNARFDSLDELYRVHGVNDQFMAAFRDRLTVYPDINRRPNINTDDPVMMGLAIMSVADPAKPDPRLTDPVFLNELITRIRAARMFSFFGMSVQDFVAVVEAAGVPVNPAVKSNVAGNRLVGDKSQTFTIKSVGEAGNVQKTLTAVVRLDDSLGRLLYWREE
ncbi:general secretion pathway protein GspK [Pyxidicoccus fallax]|uniref:General secretion pathway protein GspK n=1 Tax=Pyxidicoccus fallax TaxID=394095 RepID=A0A848LU89_9BACT|nr:type II secretion system protein GspK [Pyxidicoccus fallax]NMO21588.1 general secretion pathway protein GspK [Pyxidicoccus fallax]NPC82829.1 general secretion pathway protein GspK [Pyxidicoccus fallax]